MLRKYLSCRPMYLIALVILFVCCSSIEAKAGGDGWVRVEVVSGLPESDGTCDTGLFRVTWDMGSPDFTGAYDRPASIKILNATYSGVSFDMSDDSVTGSCEFVVTGIKANGTYTCSLLTGTGNKYYCDVTINFVEGGKQTSSQDMDLSTDIPNVSFTDYPDGKGYPTGTKITLNMHTDNVKTNKVFDGSGVDGDGVYTNVTPIIVTRNGNFYYTAVTAMGRQVSGYLTIDFFDDTKFDYSSSGSDPGDNGIASSGGTTGTIGSTDTSLSQTGIEADLTVFIVAGVLVFAGVFVLMFRKIKDCGGVKNEK